MGPRLFRRGNPRKNSPKTSSLWLQWGHVFSDVEILSAGAMLPFIHRASMGPRLFRRGNYSSLPHPDSQRCASMGPRLFRRGNNKMATVVSVWIGASMGPRLFRRGNGTPCRSCSRTHAKLQWGHVFSDVEMIALSAASGDAEAGFNGATSFQTWK